MFGVVAGHPAASPDRARPAMTPFGGRATRATTQAVRWGVFDHRPGRRRGAETHSFDLRNLRSLSFEATHPIAFVAATSRKLGPSSGASGSAVSFHRACAVLPSSDSMSSGRREAPVMPVTTVVRVGGANAQVTHPHHDPRACSGGGGRCQLAMYDAAPSQRAVRCWRSQRLTSETRGRWFRTTVSGTSRDSPAARAGGLRGGCSIGCGSSAVTQQKTSPPEAWRQGS